MTSSSPGRNAPLRYWFHATLWSVLILLVFELAIRLFVIKTPARVYLPEWGVVPVENSYSVQGTEGYGLLDYLANGEVRTPYQDGRSIVVLGDSTTLAAQVDPDKNFVSQTEILLRKRGQTADLHNLGRSARIMADHIFLAPAVNQTFNPDVVVVQVSPDSFTLSYDPSAENHFAEEADGTLKLVHQTPSAVQALATRNLVTSSGLLDFFEFRLWFVVDDLVRSHPGLIKNPFAAEVGNMNAAPPVSIGLSEDGYQVFRQQVVAQVQALKAAYPNSHLILLVIPSPPKISDVAGEIEWTDLEDAYLASVLNKLPGITVVYPERNFRRFYEQYKVLPRGSFNSAFNFGHLNANGHRAVAQALAEALEETLK